MTAKDLERFLTDTMSMSEVYQPVIIKQLLLGGGRGSTTDLAARLADNDESVQEYYRRVLMRWPKATLTKHDVVEYNKSTREFKLLVDAAPQDISRLVELCDQRIAEWIESRRQGHAGSGAGSSIRYQVLKAARGKCQLCGVPAELRPIDVDHIVPRTMVNRYGKVVLNGRPVGLNSIENLQALCFRCNRAKRDQDDTDWRRTRKLVRDQVPSLIKQDGRAPVVRRLQGRAFVAALRDKLVEEVAEYLHSGSLEELADISEVVRALVREEGATLYEMEDIRATKVRDRGGFEEGWFYEGDK